jgi:hypothetical protein
MTLFKRYYCLLPLLLIVLEIIINQTVNFSPVLNPSSSQNDFTNTLSDYIHIANISPLNLTVYDSLNEIDFYLQNPDKSPFQVILSTDKDALKQVTALQKLIKIANIKGNDIKFIDLSSARPYATF